MRRLRFRAAPVAATACLLALFATACGSSDAGRAEAETKATIAKYHSYLEQKAAELVHTTGLLVLPIHSGKVPRSQSFFVIARVPYGELKPFAASFGKLDSRIDAQPGEVPAGEFGGFHRLEKTLWVAESTKGILPAAKRLAADAEALQRRVKTARLRPARLAEEAAKTLDQTSTSTVAGKEDPYTDADVVDVAAQLEGAGAAYEAIEPLVAAKDSALAEEIHAGFAGLYEALAHYGSLARNPHPFRPNAPGAIFIEYSELSPAEVQKLTAQLQALDEKLSRVPALIGE